MDAVAKKPRLHTSHATLAALSIWALNNKADLDNRPLGYITAKAREAFNGQVITTKAVNNAIGAAGITPGQVKRKGVAKTHDRAALVARCTLAIVNRIEKAIGASGEEIITNDERELLGKIAQRASLKDTREAVGS